MGALFLILFLLGNTKASGEPNRITQNFQAQINLPYPNAKALVRSVIYGNSLNGYFETEDLIFFQNNIKLDIVPPGYKHAIFFFVKMKDGSLKKIKQILFPRPFKTPLLKEEGEKIHGRFYTPYFLLTGSKRADDTQILFYIVNAEGEVVWVYAPENNERGILKQTGPGTFILGTRTRFAWIDSKGMLIKSLTPKVPPPPYSSEMIHDFLPLPNGKIATLHYITRKFFFLRGFLPEVNWIIGDAIVLVDSKTGEISYGWDSFQTHKIFDPWKSPPSVFFDDFGGENHFLFTQADSLSEFGERNFLLALKGTNQILLLDSDLHKVKASIGMTTENRYKIQNEKDRFYAPYPASSSQNGHILLIDHNPIKLRVLELALDQTRNQVSCVKEYFPSMQFYSKRRGSVFEVDNGKEIDAYFSNARNPEDRDYKNAFDYLAEFDRASGKEIASMRFISNYHSALRHSESYRAQPLEAIGRERFIGYQLVPQ